MDLRIPQTSLTSLFNRFKLEFYQAVYWVGYFLLTLAKNTQLNTPYPWWFVLFADLLVIGIVYTIVLIFSRAYLRPVRGTLVLALTFLLYSLLYYGLIYVILPQFGYVVYDESANFTWVIFLFSMFLYFHHAMVEAGLLAAIYRIRADARQKQELTEKNHQTQVQFLTAQIDPHEHANLLNIPYQMAFEAGNKEVAEALVKVKERLLYVPEKANDVGSEVSLGAEMKQCGRIVWLNGKRFPKCFVTMDVPEELHHWTVPVFSVSALLQNAFKYGVAWDEYAPISLRAWQEGNRLIIQLRNKINPNKSNEPSSGIGNDNIRQRLALLYGGLASLDTSHTPDGWYEATLTLTKS